MQLISPISSFKTSPSIGANLFYLKFSSLRIRKLNIQDKGGHAFNIKLLAYPKAPRLVSFKLKFYF